MLVPFRDDTDSEELMCLMPLLALAAVALPHTVPAATYHVAQTPNASDENAGTEVRPWKTIARAVNAVQPGEEERGWGHFPTLTGIVEPERVDQFSHSGVARHER